MRVGHLRHPHGDQGPGGRACQILPTVNPIPQTISPKSCLSLQLGAFWTLVCCFTWHPVTWRATYARPYLGVKVTGITISNEQYAEARARVKAAGLEAGPYSRPHFSST